LFDLGVKTLDLAFMNLPAFQKSVSLKLETRFPAA